MLRSFFRNAGMAATFAIFLVSICILISAIDPIIGKFSILPYSAILTFLSVPLLRLMSFYMNESPNGSSIKLTYAFWPWGRGNGDIHQTTGSLVLQRLSETPIFKPFISTKSKFSIARSILNDAAALTVKAMETGSFISIKLKSHLLNHAGASDNIKKIVLSMYPKLTCRESEEKLDFFSRCLIAWATKKTLKEIPKKVKTLVFHL